MIFVVHGASAHCSFHRTPDDRTVRTQSIGSTNSVASAERCVPFVPSDSEARRARHSVRAANRRQFPNGAHGVTRPTSQSEKMQQNFIVGLRSQERRASALTFRLGGRGFLAVNLAEGAELYSVHQECEPDELVGDVAADVEISDAWNRQDQKRAPHGPPGRITQFHVK